MTTPKKPKAHPEDAAKAVFRISTRKPADLVVSTNQLLENVKKHPQYGNQPAMQQAVTMMSGITDTLTKQDTDIGTARTNLIALMSARQLTVHSFMRARRSLLPVADQIAAGSPSTLNEWGFGATSMNTPLPPSTDPPTGLRVRYNKALELEILWKSVPGHRGYVLQIGDGTPTGWGSVIQPEGALHADGAHAWAEDRDPRRRAAEERALVLHRSAQRDRALSAAIKAVHTGRPGRREMVGAFFVCAGEASYARLQTSAPTRLR